MLDHLGFGVSDYERSRAFYREAFAPLGVALVVEIAASDNPSGHPAAGFGRDGRPDFWIGGEGATRPPLHVAITASSRTQVDAFHRAALAAGATDDGAPGPRPRYGEHYYAAFVRDPDGHNVEAVCHAPE